MENEKLIEKNWKQIKNEIKTRWNNLFDEDIEEINGSHKILVKKLQSLYGKTEDDAITEIALWLNKYKNNTIHKNNNLNESLEEAARLCGKKAKKYLDEHEESVDNLVKCSSEYVKNNPISSVLISFVAGVFVAKMIGK